MNRARRRRPAPRSTLRGRSTRRGTAQSNTCGAGRRLDDLEREVAADDREGLPNPVAGDAATDQQPRHALCAAAPAVVVGMKTLGREPRHPAWSTGRSSVRRRATSAAPVRRRPVNRRRCSGNSATPCPPSGHRSGAYSLRAQAPCDRRPLVVHRTSLFGRLPRARSCVAAIAGVRERRRRHGTVPPKRRARTGLNGSDSGFLAGNDRHVGCSVWPDAAHCVEEQARESLEDPRLGRKRQLVDRHDRRDLGEGPASASSSAM